MCIYCAFIVPYNVFLSYILIFLTNNKIILQIIEHNSQAGIPQQLDQKQVLSFLQGECIFHVNLIHWSLRFSFDQVLWNFEVTYLLLNISSKRGNSFYFYLIFSEKYEPVYANWTTERCAICRWVEDWEDNKIIICHRYSYYCSWPLAQAVELGWIC